MPPRLHNTLSYSVAALSLPVTVVILNPASFTTLPVLFWIFHFLRRTAESLWVHRYSGRPVPWSDALIEYVYYWGFGIWIGSSWAGMGPSLVEVWSGDAAVAVTVPLVGVSLGGLVLGLIGEAGNAWAHLALRRLRAQAGSSERRLPSGGLFNLIDCPHYLFEILSWVGFALLTHIVPSWVFLAAVCVILAGYARTRHKRYREEFDGREGRPAYPARRRALLPGIF